MDDYLSMNTYEYVGDKKQEYSTATNMSKEEHEMLKIAPQKVHQQPQFNQSSTARSENQVQEENKKNGSKAKMKCFIVMAMIILAVTLLISLAAMVLSILSYNASSNSIGLKTSVMSVASVVKQNISQLSMELGAVYSNITLLSTAMKNNISYLFIQLDAVNNLAIIKQAETTRMHCGDGVWYRIAHLNMSNPSQQCPSAWREYNTSTHQFRACGRPVSTGASHPSHMYSINRPYSKVCGRVVGIQVASPDAFLSGRGINDSYIDGVSITYGSPRNHIWSYVGSYSEIAENDYVCPCDYSSAIQPPPFVGSSYYCESGNPTQEWETDQEFPNDKLWDGEQCSREGTCCTGTNTPPWFSVSLGNPTSDDIEVRIMGTESTTNEDTPIELLEIYVQ